MTIRAIFILVLQCMIIFSDLQRGAQKPANNKHDCECIDVTMVCSFRDRTTFGPKDRCKGTTTHVLLNGNRITSLQANAFKGLTQLEWLVLASNNLTTLPQEMLKDTRNLQNLLLNRNQIKSLPEGVFSDLTKLKNIDLSENQLQKLPSRIFSGLRSIKTIMLSRNVLTTLDKDMFRGLKYLEVLDLSHNQISSLPRGLFLDLASLKSLILTSNRLTAMEGKDIMGLKSLESLKVDNNLLTALPYFHSLWPAVNAAFYFSGNRIRDVSEEVLRTWLNADDYSRILVLSNPGTAPLSSPESLRWVVGDATVKITAASACQCGMIRKGKAEIRFCVDVRCGGKDQPKNWIAAVSRRKY